MKLSKARLIKLVKSGLEKLGFMEFNDTINGTQGFFTKKLESGLYLTLGLIIHRYYDDAFTGAFYLSKTTRWGSVWDDIPKESYRRPGYFLTDRERSIYPENEINTIGSYDIWWNGSDEKAILNFLRVIELTEPRFANQSDLIRKIENSQEIKMLSKYADKVNDFVGKNQLQGSYKFTPSKEVDNIPMDWFKASEKVLNDNKGILNANTVKLLASDAYRQYCLDNT